MTLWNARAVDHWRTLPYPGERPDHSWRLVGDVVNQIAPVRDRWSDTVTGECLDLSDRVFILAYGSNANPAKLRGMDAVMIQAEIIDGQSVWCNRRRRDGSVVSTLVRVPGHVEPCPVLAVTPEDLQIVDGWEYPAYERDAFWGRCTLENGVIAMPEVYVGGPDRQPLFIDGELVPLHRFGHAYVHEWVPE